ncbi:hypothetical protein OA871_03610 [Paracoccaceae bacterium]|nr:hypothetical protein [Paracoccaceae bacterium]
MNNQLNQNIFEEKKIEEDFYLAFKVVFFDEKNNEIDPPKYKKLNILNAEIETNNKN